MNQLVDYYDMLIHEWLMRPIFERVQKMFHINRFDLIRYSLYCFFAYPTSIVLGIGAALKSGDLLTAFIAAATAGVMLPFVIKMTMDLIPELEDASTRFEDRQFTGFHGHMLWWAQIAKTLRYFGNINTPIVTFCVMSSSSENVTMQAAMILLEFFTISAWVEAHLWDIDDIDPDDRDHLFDPDYAEQKSC